MTGTPEDRRTDAEIEAELDRLIAECALEDHAKPLSEALTVRILADAAAETAQRQIPAARPRRDWVREALDLVQPVFGGWQGGLALASAAILGMYLGYAAPLAQDATTLGLDQAAIEDLEDSEALVAFLFDG